MPLTSLVRTGLNHALKPLNLRIETLTQTRNEDHRLELLRAIGHFDEPVFEVPKVFANLKSSELLASLPSYRWRFKTFQDPLRNDVAFTFQNAYFGSPDAEILYALVRHFQPKTVIEVGSGNSTKIFRQAIIDGALSTRLISVDPDPRTGVEAIAELRRVPVESEKSADLFCELAEGDILFIDSSHQIRTGSDVVFLFLKVVPQLRPGVLIHVHDIFLPYEYPWHWVRHEKWAFSEQYLVQSILSFSAGFEVLWASYFLQKTVPEFRHHFPNIGDQIGSSLWLRKLGGTHGSDFPMCESVLATISSSLPEC